jgi:hypothetical protein
MTLLQLSEVSTNMFTDWKPLLFLLGILTLFVGYKLFYYVLMRKTSMLIKRLPDGDEIIIIHSTRRIVGQTLDAYRSQPSDKPVNKLLYISRKYVHEPRTGSIYCVKTVDGKVHLTDTGITMPVRKKKINNGRT